MHGLKYWFSAAFFAPGAYFTELGLFRIFTGEVGEIKT